MYKAKSSIHFIGGDHTVVEGSEFPFWGTAHDDIGRRINRAVEENQTQVVRIITYINKLDG